VARSALIAAQAGKHRRGWLLPRLKRQRWRQLAEISRRRVDLASCAQTLQRARLGQRRQERHWTTAVGHLDRLARCHPAQEFACALPQLPYPDGGDVLPAHFRVLRRKPVGVVGCINSVPCGIRAICRKTEYVHPTRPLARNAAARAYDDETVSAARAGDGAGTEASRTVAGQVSWRQPTMMLVPPGPEVAAASRTWRRQRPAWQLGQSATATVAVFVVAQT
jgi:hypothetical protein